MVAKKKSTKKEDRFNYASEVYPPVEYADFVRVSYSMSNPIILLSFGQSHPDRKKTTLTREIVLPESICLLLKQVLDDHFEKKKKKKKI